MFRLLVSGNQSADVVEDGFVIQRRLRERFDECDHGLGVLRDQQSGVRQFASINRGVYASPAFLQRQGTPADIGDFGRFDCIVTEHQRTEGVWTFRSFSGDKIIDVAGRIAVNHIGVARELVIGGVGLGILPNIMCQNDIRTNRLVRVLTAWESPPLEVSATFLGRRKESRRLRAFLDVMSEQLNASDRATA
jgi:LysR family transcriptional regulator for bpeEF and oprC